MKGTEYDFICDGDCWFTKDSPERDIPVGGKGSCYTARETRFYLNIMLGFVMISYSFMIMTMPVIMITMVVIVLISCYCFDIMLLF